MAEMPDPEIQQCRGSSQASMEVSGSRINYGVFGSHPGKFSSPQEKMVYCHSCRSYIDTLAPLQMEPETS